MNFRPSASRAVRFIPAACLSLALAQSVIAIALAWNAAPIPDERSAVSTVAATAPSDPRAEPVRAERGWQQALDVSTQ